jgi:hypothetical protein
MHLRAGLFTLLSCSLRPHQEAVGSSASPMEHSPLAALEQATLSTVLEYLHDVDLLSIGESGMPLSPKCCRSESTPDRILPRLGCSYGGE